MSDAPDYSTYTLAELEDAARHIDKNRYADRIALISAEIRKRLEGQQPSITRKKDADNAAKRPRRRWLSAILVLIGGIALIALLQVFGASQSLKSTPAFEDALFFARQNPEVAAALGDSLEVGMLVQGAMTQEDDWSRGWPPRQLETANLTIPLSGPNGTGVLTVEGKKTEEVWEFSVLEVSVEGQDSLIDLIDRTQVVAAAKKPGKKNGGWGGRKRGGGKKWGDKDNADLSEVDQLKQSSAFLDALFYAKNSATVVAALGHPIENSEPEEVSYSSEMVFGQGPPKMKGDTAFKLTLTGSNGSGELTVSGKRDGRVWEFSTLQVKTDEQVIDLITDTEMIEDVAENG